MQNYQYTALNSAGDLIEGAHTAETESAVIQHLQAQGHYPITVKPAEQQQKPFTLPFRLFPDTATRLSFKQRLILTQQLGTLLNAGLDIEHSLSSLIKARPHPALGKLVTALHRDLQAGRSLSESLCRHPGMFDAFYISIIRAGEASGQLGKAFTRLTMHLQKIHKTRNAMVTSLTYPALLTAVACLSVIFLLGFVIPRFQPLVADNELTLPWVSRLVFSAATFFQHYGWWLLIVLSACLVLFFPLLRRRLHLWQAGTLALRLPVLGNLLKLHWSALFARTMATLLSSGLELVEALQLSKDTLSNLLAQDELSQTVDAVKNGEPLAQALDSCDFLPPLARTFVSLGEESGKLPDMFTRMADNYEQEIEHQLKRLLIFLEPILILGLGILIAFLIVGVLMAVLSLNETIFQG